MVNEGSMVKMIDNSPSLNRITPSVARRKNITGTFDVDEELPNINSEKPEPSKIQSSALVQRIALLKIKNTINHHELETISYGDELLKQLKGLQYQLLEGEVSHNQLQELEETLDQLPCLLSSTPHDLKEIITDIQVRVAVELAKLSINR
jgi:hypothetical protein